MKLWIVHPAFLDAIALKQLWEDALLAQDLIKSRKHDFPNSIVLKAFREHTSPMVLVGRYLCCIYNNMPRVNGRPDYNLIEQPNNEITSHAISKIQFDRDITKLRYHLKNVSPPLHKLVIQLDIIPNEAFTVSSSKPSIMENSHEV